MERVRRTVFTLFFMVTMIASLMMLSAPVLVAAGDILISLLLASRFACARCYGFREHMDRYGFTISLMDIPLASIIRSLVLTCVYSWYEGSGFVNVPYFGTATFCSTASVLMLCIKACFFNPTLEIYDEGPLSVSREKLKLKLSWGMAVLFLSSLVFALAHVVVAYRTTTKARRKLLFHRLDPEAVLACKSIFSGNNKVPRSPTPYLGKFSKSNSEIKRKTSIRDEHEQLPVSLLAEVDSMFVACNGIVLHYKISSSDSPFSLGSSPFADSSSSSSPTNLSTVSFLSDRSLDVTPKSNIHINGGFSNQFNSSTLYAPLLTGSVISPTLFPDEIPDLSLNNTVYDASLPGMMNTDIDLEDSGKFGIVLIHGFGGGVFSWRHVVGVLAQEVGCPVVAFDRPGWGLTSRPRRKDWEKKQLPNPYMLESQVDLLLSFCSCLGLSSVVLVGHDDGGLLALKAVEKVRTFDSINVEIKGVVLLGVSLSREVVPAFARILLHTSLGKKHMVRPLLRTEITQVINRRAWYDSTKLTSDVLNLYKTPLFVEGWDEALHEIGRLSFATVLSPQNAEALLRSVEDLPILVVAGAEDALVSLKYSQAMASKLVNSRLVSISGCGHLPHEECPKVLLATLSPFITRLLFSQHTFERQ